MEEMTRRDIVSIVEKAMSKILGKKVNLEVELRNDEFGEIAEETLDFLEGKTLEQGLTTVEKTLDNFIYLKKDLDKKIVELTDEKLLEYYELENEIAFLEIVMDVLQEEIVNKLKKTDDTKRAFDRKAYRKSRWMDN